MPTPQLDDTLRQAIKDAVAEVFEEKAEVLRSMIEEIVVDIAFAHAMDQEADSPEVGRDEIMAVLEDHA